MSNARGVKSECRPARAGDYGQSGVPDTPEPARKPIDTSHPTSHHGDAVVGGDSALDFGALRDAGSTVSRQNVPDDGRGG
jgi:hypothetical protein